MKEVSEKSYSRCLAPALAFYRTDLVLILLLFSTSLWQYFVVENLRTERRVKAAILSAEGKRSGGWVSKNTQIRGYIASPIEHPGGGTVRFILSSGEQHTGSDDFIVKLPGYPWQAGATLATGDSIEVFGKMLCPGEIGAESYLLRRRAVCFFSGEKVISRSGSGAVEAGRQKFAVRLEASYGRHPSLSVLMAVTLGLKESLGTQTFELFRNTGTSHLLVISGFHVGLVFTLSFLCLRKFLLCSERLTILLPVDIPAAWLALFVAGFYCWLCGGALPAVRAMVVLAVFAVGKILGRRTSAGRNLLLALLFVQLIWPGAIFEVGCQLTFSALFGLWCALPWLQDANEDELNLQKEKRPHQKVARLLSKTAMASFAAWLGTAPVAIWWFQHFVPLATFFNAIFVLPFCALFVVAGFFVVGVTWIEMPGSDFLLFAVLQMADWFLEVIAWTSFGVDSLGLGALSIPIEQRTWWTIAAATFALTVGTKGVIRNIRF